MAEEEPACWNPEAMRPDGTDTTPTAATTMRKQVTRPAAE